jgi:acetylserotonin N-methyltransferase
MTNYASPTTDDRRIWDLWLASLYQGAIVAADDGGVFNVLARAPATILDLSAELDFDVRATGVLVRLLAALGLLVPRDESFQLTDQSRLYLVKDSPYYWGHMMCINVNESHRAALLERLKRKGSAEAPGSIGSDIGGAAAGVADAWAAGKMTIQQARVIAAGMHSHSLPAAIGAARNYDLTGVERILDVGGGSGCFMIAMAQRHPALRCTIMELDTMCDLAQSYIDAGGVSDRIETVAVDMFRQAWPKGHNAVFFSNIWHDWNFKTCTWLAERAYDVLPIGGRIMLHEMLLDDDGVGPVTTAAFSLLMLLGTQGQQFTFKELKSILEGVGFRDIDTVQTAGYYSITSAFKLRA